MSDSPEVPLADIEELLFQKLYDDTWTEPRANDPTGDWHRRFPQWQARHAARLSVAALSDAGYEVVKRPLGPERAS